MPEGKPLIPDELIDMLHRNGIDLDTAEADFRLGEDAMRGDKYMRIGHLATYEYRRMVVFGHTDYLVTKINLFA
jgi:hypothetical protein